MADILGFKSPILLLFFLSFPVLGSLFSFFLASFCLQFFLLVYQLYIPLLFILCFLNISLTHYFYHLLGYTRPLEHLNSIFPFLLIFMLPLLHILVLFIFDIHKTLLFYVITGLDLLMLFLFISCSSFLSASLSFYLGLFPSAWRIFFSV